MLKDKKFGSEVNKNDSELVHGKWIIRKKRRRRVRKRVNEIIIEKCRIEKVGRYIRR